MIRVLIVDDSITTCQIIAKGLSKFSGIKVIDYASDPYVAREKIAVLNPNLIILDIEMPRMNGLSFLNKLMAHFPLPVIIVSSLTYQSSEKASQALELGAIEVIAKPVNNSFNDEFFRKLILTAQTSTLVELSEIQLLRHNQILIKDILTSRCSNNKILAIGASTGGIKAIEQILREFPTTCPATLIAQHLPEAFSAQFTRRLSEMCPAKVSEALDYEIVVPGKILIAPSDSHMVLERDNNNYYVRVKEGPKIHFHRPSVDVLFHSVARSAAKNAIGVILTGMGVDGAKGLLAMQKAGAITLAQDEKDCIVFGMPKEAIKLGAANLIVPISEMSEVILTLDEVL